jgi:hypothetical protein
MSEGAKSGRSEQAAREEERTGLPHPTTGPSLPPNAARRRSGAWRNSRFSGWLSVLRRVFGHAPEPREHRVRRDLPPIETAADVGAMLAAIATAVERRSVTPAEVATALGEVVGTYIRAIVSGECERRLQALEAAHAAKS